MTAHALRAGPPRLQIGDWLADPATNELCRDGRAVRVEPKVMEVLVVLAERAGTVVSREELLARVWPGVVVGEEALTQSIIKLRRALGDSARVPAYIGTISKRGYRLIAAVHVAEDGAPDAGAAPGAGAAPAGLRRGPAVLIALAMIVAGVFAWIAFDAFDARYVAPPSVRGAAEVPDAAGLDAPEMATLAVLPFEATGGAVGPRELAGALGGDLMTDLSRLSGIRVISIAGMPPAASSTARYALAGNVQLEADVLRVNLRLVDARSGELLWTHRFERPQAELFALQAEIGRTVSEHLLGKLSDAEQRRLARRHTNSLEAYAHFVRAQALFLVRRSDANDAARALYNKALEADPAFARAYAGLAMTYAMDYRYQRSADASATLERALELAETAKGIDPEIAEVHWALGFVHTQRRHHAEAIESLRKAIELNPSYADAYALMGGCYTYVGQPAKSIPLLRTAQRLNPGGGSLYFLLLGRAYLFENDVVQALLNLREALARNPDNLEARIFLTAALAAAGDRAGAQWEADQIGAAEPGFSAGAWIKTYPMTSVPQQERLLALLHTVNL